MASGSTVTALNLSALRAVFGSARFVANRVERVNAPHIRRCLATGLCRVEGTVLQLTEAGEKALIAEDARRLGMALGRERKAVA